MVLLILKQLTFFQLLELHRKLNQYYNLQLNLKLILMQLC